jgi:hypothetical protein
MPRRVFGMFHQRVQVRPTTMRCPHYGSTAVQLRYRGNRCEGRCYLAHERSGVFFKTANLREAGCPKPESYWFNPGPNGCKFRSGEWVEI